MGAFDNNDGFTTGFLGDKKKNTSRAANGLSSLFDDQSLNLSDTQRIRTFNQQSNDPDALTFNSSRTRSFNNAPRFNENQVFADNSVPKQWQNNNQNSFNVPNQMPQMISNNPSQGFNQPQPMSPTTPEQEVQQIQVADFGNNKKEMPQPIPMEVNKPQPVNIEKPHPVEFESAQVPINNEPVAAPVQKVQQKVEAPVLPELKKDTAGNTGAKLSEKKRKDLSRILNISSMGLLSFLIIFVVLVSTGVINFKKDNNTIKEKTVVTVEEQKIEGFVSKLNAACNNLDSEGNFGKEPEGVSETCTVITCYIVDNAICANGMCMISDGSTVYSKTCSTGSIKKVNAQDFQASVNLGELCNAILSNSQLKGSLEASFGTCNNFMCETEVNGKSYTQVCKGNS